MTEGSSGGRRSGMVERGEYRPELLFSNAELLQNVAEHPMAMWKMRKNQEGIY